MMYTALKVAFANKFTKPQEFLSELNYLDKVSAAVTLKEQQKTI